MQCVYLARQEEMGRDLKLFLVLIPKEAERGKKRVGQKGAWTTGHVEGYFNQVSVETKSQSVTVQVPCPTPVDLL